LQIGTIWLRQNSVRVSKGAAIGSQTAEMAYEIGEVLKTIGLTKHYNGIVAVDDVNLVVKSGDVFCLLGASCAGKTTTIILFWISSCRHRE
jgi:ABC-type proline/glycine betaine transport system ATPase subunit